MENLHSKYGIEVTGHEYEKDARNLVSIGRINYLRREEYSKYSDFAILYRTNAQSRAFEDVFMREGIPYKGYVSIHDLP